MSEADVVISFVAVAAFFDFLRDAPSPAEEEEDAIDSGAGGSGIVIFLIAFRSFDQSCTERLSNSKTRKSGDVRRRCP